MVENHNYIYLLALLFTFEGLLGDFVKEQKVLWNVIRFLTCYCDVHGLAVYSYTIGHVASPR